MDNKHVISLFRKYLDNQASAVEIRELLRYFENSEEGDDLTPLIQNELDRMENPDQEALVKAITDRVGTERV